MLIKRPNTSSSSIKIREVGKPEDLREDHPVVDKVSYKAGFEIFQIFRACIKLGNFRNFFTNWLFYFQNKQQDPYALWELHLKLFVFWIFKINTRNLRNIGNFRNFFSYWLFYIFANLGNFQNFISCWFFCLKKNTRNLLNFWNFRKFFSNCFLYFQNQHQEP